MGVPQYRWMVYNGQSKNRTWMICGYPQPSKVSTLGLWLIFQPWEDSASLLLTKQGRSLVGIMNPELG